MQDPPARRWQGAAAHELQPQPSIGTTTVYRRRTPSVPAQPAAMTDGFPSTGNSLRFVTIVSMIP
jgi:hypothetical protein